MKYRFTLPIHIACAATSLLVLVWFAMFGYPETGTDSAYLVGYTIGYLFGMTVIWGAVQIISTLIIRLSRIAKYLERKDS